MLLSTLFRDTARIITTEGWAIGREHTFSGWCLMGALGMARFRQMSPDERSQVLNPSERIIACTTPYAMLYHRDQPLRDATVVLYNLAYPYSSCDGGYADALMNYNDLCSGPGVVLSLLYRAVREAEQHEHWARLTQEDDWRWLSQQQRHMQRRIVMDSLVIEPKITDEAIFALIESAPKAGKVLVSV